MTSDKLKRRKKIPEKAVIRFNNYLKKNKISGKLLDVGCGYGRHTFFFSKKGFDSYGIDENNDRIKFAKKYSKQNKLDCKFKKIDIINDSFQKDFFDVIIDIGCFHHIPRYKYKKYIKNVLKALKKNGIFFLIVFSDKSTKFKKQGKRRKWQLEKGNYYRRLFNKKEVKDIFSKQFTIKQITESKHKIKKEVVGLSIIMEKKI